MHNPLATNNGLPIIHLCRILCLLTQFGCGQSPNRVGAGNEHLAQVARNDNSKNDNVDGRSKTGEVDSFTVADIEGSWIVDQIHWHIDDPIKSLTQIRIDVTKAKRDSVFSDAAIYLPETVKTHELVMLGRYEARDEWRRVALTDPGWIKVRKDGSYFCFGPIGDHLALKAELKNGKLRLHGEAFDAALHKLSRLTTHQEN